MNKIIGVLTGWGVEDWIRPAIEQALERCDEVMAVIAPFAPELKRFEDRTYDICKEYPAVRLLDHKLSGKNIQQEECGALNLMLKSSSLYSPGNWAWKLDSDEFYTDTAYEKIKLAIESGKYDSVYTEAKLFYIDMWHYLNEGSPRLQKILTPNDGYVPTCKWCRIPKSVYVLPRSDGMFHYSMLKDMEVRCAMWWKHPPHDTDGGYRVRWLREIYAKYDLENEDYWTEKNRGMIGIKTPWCDSGYKPDGNGRLFRYGGKHPRFIEEVGLTKIKDFREYYGEGKKE